MVSNIYGFLKHKGPFESTVSSLKPFFLHNIRYFGQIFLKLYPRIQFDKVYILGGSKSQKISYFR